MKKGIESLIAYLLIITQCSCGPKKPVDSSNGMIPREKTLYVTGLEWKHDNNFNPLVPDGDFGSDYNCQLIYECLLVYDQLKGKPVPSLAASYTLSDNAITVTIDTRARWHDGTPVTPEDVKYTFELDKIYPTTRAGTWKYLDRVEITSDSTLDFHLNRKNRNPLMVLDALTSVPILPHAVWEKVEREYWVDSLGKADFMKLMNYKNNSDIIGSGPYTLYYFDNSKVVLRRVDTYWGKGKYGTLPAPEFIAHVLFSNSDQVALAMKQGKIDISCPFIPVLGTAEAGPIRGWSLKPPYNIPGCIPTLFMPANTEPFNNVAFRRALAHAVDFAKIGSIAFANQSPTMQPGIIIPFGPESRYFSKKDAEAFGCRYDIEKARSILKQNGFTWNEKGMLLDPAGKQIDKMYAECPSGWTDWENMIKIAIEGFRGLGLDVSERFTDYASWDQKCRTGNGFDFILRTATSLQSPATPWLRFKQLLSSENIHDGEDAYENFGRYHNTEADSLLSLIPAITDSSETIRLYRQLNRLFMLEVPSIPVVYRPAVFYQFTEKHWTNFPTEDNPYAPPQMLFIGGGIPGLFHIRPVKEAS